MTRAVDVSGRGVRVSGRSVGVGSAETDSAIHQHKLDEGSGSTAADSIGSLDGSVDGASWVSVADLVGGFGLDFDGSNDKLDLGSTISEVGVNEQFSIGMTINPDNTSGDQYLYSHYASGSDRVVIAISGGSVQISLYDGSNFVGQSAIPSAATTTNRYRILATVDGSTNTTKLYKNATDETQSGGLNNVPSSIQHQYGAKGTTTNVFNGVMDNMIIYSDVLTSNEIQSDYDSQPWS